MAEDMDDQTPEITEDGRSSPGSSDPALPRALSSSRLNARAAEFVPRTAPIRHGHAPAARPVMHVFHQTPPSAACFGPGPSSFEYYGGGGAGAGAGAGGFGEHEGAHTGDDPDLSSSAGDGLSDEVIQKITKQVEYYFSDANLATTEHLMRFITKDPEGFVPISVVAAFKKIKALVHNNTQLAMALQTSTKLVVSDDGKKVRRQQPFNESDMEELQSRIVMAENLPEDHCYQNLMKVFSSVGSVKTIRTCYPQPSNGAAAATNRPTKLEMHFGNRLHAFVEYETVEDAEKAVAELNNEKNWRSGLRVRVFPKLLTKHGQGRGRKVHEAEFTGEEDVSTLNEKQVEDAYHTAEVLHEQESVDSFNDKDGTVRRGRGRSRGGRGRGRGQHLNNNRVGGHAVGTPPSSHHLIQSEREQPVGANKQPPGPRMPDGTRGFTMGRGKPVVPTNCVLTGSGALILAEMDAVAALKRGVSRQFSLGSLSRSRFSFGRHASLDPRLANARRFAFGRQSSLDPNRRSPVKGEQVGVPENLDATMQLLFLACQGDAKGVEDLLKDGVDVNSIDLDGRTALHIAACEGHVDVVKLLLSFRANIDARDRWGSTAAADAKHYGNAEVYDILKARGAKTPKARKTPMAVSNPQDVPEYELNPAELYFRQGDELSKASKWNGIKVSVKMLEQDAYSDPDTINAFKNELTLMQKVRHPNLVQFVGAVTQNIPMMIVYEYLPKGDLGSYLKKKGRPKLHKALRFALDIARHVAGFGLTKISKLSPDRCKLAHPMAHIDSLYIAPELYKNEIFDRSVDAFSFSLILYEMIEGVPVFHPKAPGDVAQMICLEGIRPILKTKSKAYPPDLNELIEECWNPQPVVRPTFSEIILRLDKIQADGKKTLSFPGNNEAAFVGLHYVPSCCNTRDKQPWLLRLMRMVQRFHDHQKWGCCAKEMAAMTQSPAPTEN
ncbi:serine threonine protein kinase [Musa troglodytarum]|uniref:Serine threonine protein kinase n=1 Tax=Musa troglodytarum TaxID=320322 RepID=A0A9E7EXY3_9LILI|nr:serine threonine protein kinase [Musa troglodytarum]